MNSKGGSMRYISANEIVEMLEESGIYDAVGQISMNLNNTSVVIKQNDTVGNILQEWLCKFLEEKEIYFRPAVGQSFPDFYLGENDDSDLCEMKTFLGHKSPGFDVANFLSYVKSIAENPYRLDSDYIIFGYNSSDEGEITIKNIWCKKVWEITGPARDYPLKCQRKNGQIVNIRPINWKSERATIQPFSCKEEFIAALYKTHLNYHNQTRITNAWLRQITDGYLEHTGEDLTARIREFL